MRASTNAETEVRIKNDFDVPSEVSRGHSKPATSSPRGEVSQKEEGPNVRMAKMNKTFMSEAITIEEH